SEDGPDAGPAWKDASENAGEFVSIRLEGPSFPILIPAKLFRSNDDPSVWTRRCEPPRQVESEEGRPRASARALGPRSSSLHPARPLDGRRAQRRSGAAIGRRLRLALDRSEHAGRLAAKRRQAGMALCRPDTGRRAFRLRRIERRG